MKLGRLGVWYSTDKLDGAQLTDFVRAVEKNGFSALWYPESRGYETVALASYLLSKSEKLATHSSRRSEGARQRQRVGASSSSSRGRTRAGPKSSRLAALLPTRLSLPAPARTASTLLLTLSPATSLYCAGELLSPALVP